MSEIISYDMSDKLHSLLFSGKPFVSEDVLHELADAQRQAILRFCDEVEKEGLRWLPTSNITIGESHMKAFNTILDSLKDTKV